MHDHSSCKQVIRAGVTISSRWGGQGRTTPSTLPLTPRNAGRVKMHISTHFDSIITDGWTDQQADRRTDGWTDGRTKLHVELRVLN